MDVLEEYIRPARMMEGGQIVTKEALSECEILDFDAIGPLEAFNTDGLRSLLFTMAHIPDMSEKTLRYPGTTDKLKLLRDSGFFDQAKIQVGGVAVRPLDMTARLLFPMWQLHAGEPDCTIMRIRIEGDQGAMQYDLYDTMDASSMHSMSRTTGYACTAVAELILDGSFLRKGISPPEYVGGVPGLFQRVLDYMKERGVFYQLKMDN
jgi:saccharopine dehydrogenase-like NADP-dependent oxidoreductase